MNNRRYRDPDRGEEIRVLVAKVPVGTKREFSLFDLTNDFGRTVELSLWELSESDPPRPRARVHLRVSHIDALVAALTIGRARLLGPAPNGEDEE